MSLKIGIDARELEVEPRGVGRVLIGLLKEWNKHARGHKFVLYFKNVIPNLAALNFSHYEKKILPVPGCIRRDRIWEQVFLPYYIKKDKLDVFFSPSYTIPLAAACPTVVAIHDISYQTHPEWFGLRQQLLLRLFTRLSVCRATRIVCCSNFTRAEISAHYGNEADAKISTVYYAPDNQFRREISQSSAVVKSYNIIKPYFLFVGSLLRRRNILRLIEAFQRTVQAYPQYRLALIGNNDEMGDDLLSLMARLGITDKVFLLRYVEEEQLPAFYREAFCFVHPSTYEGFALPVVEALACGTPTIIANAGAMVEVADGAAHVVDSLDNLAEAMIALVENPARREDLARKGPERAQRLSWGKTASAFMSAIESACEGRKAGEP